MSMQHAFERAGLNPEENRFLTALSRFLNNGGTAQRAHQLIELASGEGQLRGADEAVVSVPPARQVPREVSGLPTGAGMARGPVPDPRTPTHEKAGQGARADKAKVGSPASHAPSPASLSAARKARVAASQSVLDTFTIAERQGSRLPIGDIPVSRLERLTNAAGLRAWVSSREHHLLVLLKSHIDKQAHVPEDAKVRDVVDVRTAQEFIITSATLARPVGHDSGDAA